MEQLLAIARASVLVGAIAFSFLLGASGFYIVLREYAKASSWNKMRELISLTNDAALQTDVAKGTLELSRMRPGVAMTVVAAALMAVCVLRPFEATSHKVEGNRPALEQDIALARGVNAQQIASLVRRHLERWLGMVSELEGKDLPTQMAMLEDRAGQCYPSRLVFIADRPMTVHDLAHEAFGDSAFAPLVHAFNPALPRDGSAVHVGTRVVVLKPLLEFGQSFSITSKTLRVSANDTIGTYREVLLALATQALSHTDYTADPVEFWKRSGRSPLELADGLRGNTGRSWGYRQQMVEKGETVETVAKIVYGSREFSPVLRFLNPEHDALLADPSAELPVGMQLDIVVLVDVAP